MANTDDDRPTPPLRHSVVSRVEDLTVDAKAKAPMLGSLLEGGILLGSQELGDVLHHERDRGGLAKSTKVLAPQGAAFQAHAVSIERRKPLARWAADNDVGTREALDVLDCRGRSCDIPMDVGAEVGLICRGRMLVVLDCEDGLVASGVNEPPGHPSAPGEEVDQPVANPPRHSTIVCSHSEVTDSPHLQDKTPDGVAPRTQKWTVRILLLLGRRREPSRTQRGRVRSDCGSRQLKRDSAWADGGGPRHSTHRASIDPAWLVVSVDWWFRPEPPDKSRDFGNANIWTFRPDLDTFVREVGQNTIDVRVATTVELRFRIIQLRGEELSDFLDALRWDSTLRPHIEAATESGQKLGRSLTEGLRRLDENESLMLLRVEERGALGLIGEEFGSGTNFVGLARNNLDSAKRSATAGGAFGLGKAVLWRTSLLSTVLFNSDIDDDAYPDKDDRLIGRTELSWHSVGEDAYAGPGWFGRLEEGTAVSVWGDTELARRLCLARPDSTGTSILIPGFHDPAVDDEPPPAAIAEKLALGAARNFWPAIEVGSLKVVVETATGRGDDTVTSEVMVNPESFEPDFLAAVRAHRENAVVDTLVSEGDVVRVAVPLAIPRKRDGSQEEVEHQATVLIRRATADAADVGACLYYRGVEMIVQRQNLRGIRVGAMPFHAVVLCGEAADHEPSATVADEFLRYAEPPAHNTWELTSDLKFIYAQGGGAAIERFFNAVRAAIRDVVGPATEDLSDGPRRLKELFRMQVPVDEKTRRPEIGNATGSVDETAPGSSRRRFRIHENESGWRGRPVVVFDAESGRRKSGQVGRTRRGRGTAWRRVTTSSSVPVPAMSGFAG